MAGRKSIDADEPPPMECDGIHHEWQLLPRAPGEPGRAVARCCDARAIEVAGGWEIDRTEPDHEP